MILLGVAFFITALLYATVGFGGGSTYNALLVLADVNWRLLPIIALSCNIVVALSGFVQFWRHGYGNGVAILPWLIGSTPMALLGGALNISQFWFMVLLAISLAIVGTHLLLWQKSALYLPKYSLDIPLCYPLY